MNILAHVQCRKSLATVAEMLARCDTTREAQDFLTCLEIEVSALADGKIDSPIYQQSLAEMTGPQSYGLERIGYWPSQDNTPAIGTTGNDGL